MDSSKLHYIKVPDNNIVIDIDIPNWQKEHLKKLYDFQRNNPDKRIHIDVRPHHGRAVLYTYLKPNILKELTQNGTTSNNH